MFVTLIRKHERSVRARLFFFLDPENFTLGAVFTFVFRGGTYELFVSKVFCTLKKILMNFYYLIVFICGMNMCICEDTVNLRITIVERSNFANRVNCTG